MHDPKHFKAILGHYASGLTVVSTLVEGRPVGFTCQSFHSVSIDPPLVNFNVMRSSTSWPALRQRGQFSINVLSADQSAVSNALARSEPNKWDLIAWNETPNGNLQLSGCLFWLDCELFSEYDAGDHTLVLARVIDMQALDAIPSLQPLIYFKGQYCSISAQG